MGIEVLFDQEDSDLAKKTWNLNKGYPMSTSMRRSGGSHKTTWVLAHREVASRKIGRKINKNEVVDHLNHNTCDCTRKNLHVVSIFQNAQNLNPKKFPFRGTTQVKSGKWQASVHHKNKHYYCGLYSTREEAAEVARKKREELGFYNPYRSEQ